MVKRTDTSHFGADGSVNVDSWLTELAKHYQDKNIQLVRNACFLNQLSGAEQPAFGGNSCLRQGLTIADVLIEFHLDQETLAAAIVYSNVQYGDVSLEDIKEHLGKNVMQLVAGMQRMEVIHSTHNTQQTHSRNQIENFRKMLLAMVQDVRVVLLKLAEQLYMLRTASVFSDNERCKLAQETMDIYAPLANRLGIGQLKWELEDLAFRYLETETYKEIAKYLAQRRIDRENYIENAIKTIQQELAQHNVKHTQVDGRAKHIYSIYRKKQRKKVPYSQIYDVFAVRILVDSVADCYAALSCIHGLWPHIAEEFDDYIASPKENGYRSLHTAVVGPDTKNLEVQIRTYQMHDESELGVAAHWAYKEGSKKTAERFNKAAWLRQVLEWQKEVTQLDEPLEETQDELVEDRVYVFTPAGDVIDLMKGATPLDFAYHVHSEVGHRCRGAKIKGNIVNLTYQLQNGDQVEILTSKHGGPSRDWLNPNLGYIKSSKARAKAHHWFKEQAYEDNLQAGNHLFEREIKRLELKKLDLDKISHHLNYKTGQDMLASLGCGDLRMSQVLNAIQAEYGRWEEPKTKLELPKITQHKPSAASSNISVCGVGNLLTHMANCCKPLPGDTIIGYITQGRGVSIHRKDCQNILHANATSQERLVDAAWGEHHTETYPVDISIEAYDRHGLLRDITNVLATEKVAILGIKTSKVNTDNLAFIQVTVETAGLASLSKIIERIHQLPNVVEVKRQSNS